MADEENGGAGRLGVAHEVRGRFAKLGHRPGRRVEAGDGHRLDRVDDEDPRARLGRKIDDALDRGFGDELETPGFHAEPPGALGHLAHGFLACRIKNAVILCERRGALQEQGRLADARLTADQRHGSRNQPATQDAVEFREPGRQTRFRLGDEPRDRLRSRGDARVPAPSAANTRFREWRERVPLAA